MNNTKEIGSAEFVGKYFPKTERLKKRMDELERDILKGLILRDQLYIQAHENLERYKNMANIVEGWEKDLQRIRRLLNANKLNGGLS